MDIVVHVIEVRITDNQGISDLEVHHLQDKEIYLVGRVREDRKGKPKEN